MTPVTSVLQETTEESEDSAGSGPPLLKEKPMLNRLCTYLSRLFEPYLYTPEGFRLTKHKYVAPEHTENLPADEKRTITVCNLFSNQHKGIDEIAKLLDTNRGAVISVLIQEGLVVDRRAATRSNRKVERRQ
jgi:hypothetical protein